MEARKATTILMSEVMVSMGKRKPVCRVADGL
jgi:hypothetical protein